MEKVMYKGANFSALKKMLILQKKTFKLTLSNYSGKLEFKQGSQDIKVKFLMEIKEKFFFMVANKIKNECAKSDSYLTYIDSEMAYSKPDYFFHKSINKEIINNDNVLLVDINAAYPNTLKMLGFISDETFNFIMKLHKKTRLSAIGMLAAKKTIFYYENGELNPELTIEKKADTAFIFHLISNYVGQMLMNFSVNNYKDFYFFWVDGAVMKNTPETIENAKVFFNELEMPYKIVDLSNFSLDNNGRKIDVIFHEKEKVKKFSFPNLHHMNIVNSLSNNQTKTIKQW